MKIFLFLILDWPRIWVDLLTDGEFPSSPKQPCIKKEQADKPRRNSKKQPVGFSEIRSRLSAQSSVALTVVALSNRFIVLAQRPPCTAPTSSDFILLASECHKDFLCISAAFRKQVQVYLRLYYGDNGNRREIKPIMFLVFCSVPRRINLSINRHLTKITLA